jgi:hypothetical protein
MCVGAVGMSNIDKANKRALRGIKIKCVRVPERERECVGGWLCEREIGSGKKRFGNVCVLVGKQHKKEKRKHGRLSSCIEEGVSIYISTPSFMVFICTVVHARFRSIEFNVLTFIPICFHTSAV